MAAKRADSLGEGCCLLASGDAVRSILTLKDDATLRLFVQRGVKDSRSAAQKLALGVGPCSTFVAWIDSAFVSGSFTSMLHN